MAQDRYRYFRIEARELLDELAQGILDLEKGTHAPDLVNRLLRLAHTLKGAARVVRLPEIAEQAHALEDGLAPLRESAATLDRSQIDRLLRTLDDLNRRLAALGAPAEPGEPATITAAPDELFLGFRPDPADMEDLFDGVGDVHAQIVALSPTLDQLEKARHLADLIVDQSANPQPAHAGLTDARRTRPLSEELRSAVGTLERTLVRTVEHIDRRLRDVRETAGRLRLVPVKASFPFLDRAVRDAASVLGKEARFEAIGGEIRVDATVLGILQSALLQIVRNAVAHGIEPARERTAKGKPAIGCVTITVRRRGSVVTFECVDDGRGMDLDAIRQAIERTGAAADASRLDQEELLTLLLQGGVSTSSRVTDVSGRGIGLDVVRDAADRVGGRVAFRTESGSGTTVELTVPLSLTSFEVLVVESGGTRTMIPLEAVRHAVRLGRSDIAGDARGSTVACDGARVPFSSLEEILTGLPWQEERMLSAIVVRTRTGAAALGVDRIVGTSHVVLKPLPALAPAAPYVAGASIDAEGNLCLVLEPEGLIAEVRRRPLSAAPAESPRARVLVVDDSLTTRMLEQSVLESAGYDVDVAVSAEEALAKVASGTYALFLVDVEMPGMDGFTFVERVGADPRLRHVPSILVTSRNSAADRQRGEEVGARGYVVKGEFDQRALLERIRQLLD